MLVLNNSLHIFCEISHKGLSAWKKQTNKTNTVQGSNSLPFKKKSAILWKATRKTDLWASKHMQPRFGLVLVVSLRNYSYFIYLVLYDLQGSNTFIFLKGTRFIRDPFTRRIVCVCVVMSECCVCMILSRFVGLTIKERRYNCFVWLFNWPALKSAVAFSSKHDHFWNRSI